MKKQEQNRQIELLEEVIKRLRKKLRKIRKLASGVLCQD